MILPPKVRFTVLIIAPLLGLLPNTLLADSDIFSISDQVTHGEVGWVPNSTRASSLSECVHLSASAGARYDDNIYLTHTDEESDVIYYFSPTMSVSNGVPGTARHIWGVSYTPSFQMYQSNSDRDSVGHYVTARYDVYLPKTLIGVYASYANTSGSDRYVSGTVDEEFFDLKLNLSHELSGKMQFDLAAGTEFQDFDSSNLYGNDGYYVDAALLYEMTGKIRVGPSVRYSEDDVSSGPDHDAFSYGLRSTYQMTGKTAASLSVGFENRDFTGDEGENSTVWNFGLDHDFSHKSNLSMSVYQRSNPAYNLINSGYVATGVNLQAIHELSEMTRIDARVLYENNDYYSTDDGGAGVLDNDYFSVQLGIDHILPCGLSLGADVSWRNNDSNIELAEFSAFELGLNVSYSFF